MDISVLLQNFPHCRLCGEEDNQIILEFLKTQSMNLGFFSLRYDRGPNFFSFNSDEEILTLMIFDKDPKDIVGIGCIAKRQCLLNGQATNYYYNSDLRIKPGQRKELREEWRLCHAKLIEKLNRDGPKFCAILDQNEQAIKSLTQKHDDLIFHSVKKYYSINVMGSLLGLYHFFPTDYAVSDSLSDEEFQIFYENEGKIKSLASYPNKRKGQKIVVKNSAGLIQAICTLVVQKNRKLIVSEISTTLRVLNIFLILLGVKAITLNKSLNFLYLDHLIFQNNLAANEKRKILASILKFIFKNKIHKNFHFVSFPSFPEEFLEKDLKWLGYIFQKIPGTLYQMIHKNLKETEKRYQFEEGDLPQINLSEL